MEKISFGAGCFWGVEHAFKQVEGVIETRVGYQGGQTSNPTYKEVCHTETGHAEVVEVTFDSQIISLKRLLDAFFFIHDPTQLNRQGPDTGTQYRSCIFPTTVEQRNEVQDYLDALKRSSRYGMPVVTTIESGEFHSAEDYHQNYLDQTPGGYCHIGFDVFQKLKSGNY